MVGVGASVIVPDATGSDAAAVLLVLVFVLRPCVPVAGERRRKRKTENKKKNKNEPHSSGALSGRGKICISREGND